MLQPWPRTTATPITWASHWTYRHANAPPLPLPFLSTPFPSPFQFMVDHIHPNNLGKKLFADILSHPILRARGDLRELEARPAIQLPSRAMTPGGGLLYNKQCYMVLDPRMQHMMDVRKISKAFLPIVKSTGWSLVFHDKGNNTSADVPPLKPGGWVGSWCVRVLCKSGESRWVTALVREWVRV